MDNDKAKVNPDVTIQLGKKAIVDLQTGTKIIKYSQIEADKFNNTCSFYYKDINVADEMKETGVNSACCFVFRLPVGEQTICNAKKFHCLFSTLQLLKSLKEGCKSAGKDGLQLPQGAQMVQEKEEEMKEILGLDTPKEEEEAGETPEKHQGMVAKQYWNLTDFEEQTGPGAAMKLDHTTKENSTIKEEDKIWKGWMWVTDVTKKPAAILWVEVDKEGFRIKESPIVEENKYDLKYNHLKVTCQAEKNQLCHLEPFVDQISDNVDFETMDETKVAKDIEVGGIQAGGNQFCRVGLFKVPKAKELDFGGKTLNEKQHKYRFRDYKSQVILFCTIQVDVTYIISFNTVVIMIWEFMVKVFDINLMIEAYSGE